MNDHRLPTAKDIERWYASSFDEILGNREIVQYFSDAVRSGGTLANTLLTGDSRSGKTSAIKTLARTLLCLNLDTDTLRTCGHCASCTEDLARRGNRGIFAYLHINGVRREEAVHFVPIDCTHITDTELRDLLFELQDYDGRRIVYLDEIHRLQRRGLDELLLKPLEERNFTWIASSAILKGLEPMFLKRFPVKLRTTVPERGDFAVWLAERCRAWSLVFDEPRTLLRIVDGSHGSPGLALNVLARAACMPSRTITAQLVDNHCFDAKE